MAFADGWVCAACWKPNRPRDDRCYRCKTPRGAERQVVEEKRTRLAAATEAPEAPEAVPDLVLTVPVALFGTLSWIWRKLALVVLVLSVVIGFFGLSPGLLIAGAIVAAIYYIVGRLYGAVANGMRNRSLFAIVGGLIIAGLATLGHVVELFFVATPTLPAEAPAWIVNVLGVALLLSWISFLANGAAAICAFLALVLSVVRRPIRA